MMSSLALFLLSAVLSRVDITLCPYLLSSLPLAACRVHNVLVGLETDTPTSRSLHIPASVHGDPTSLVQAVPSPPPSASGIPPLHARHRPVPFPPLCSPGPAGSPISPLRHRFPHAPNPRPRRGHARDDEERRPHGRHPASAVRLARWRGSGVRHTHSRATTSCSRREIGMEEIDVRSLAPYPSLRTP